MPLEMKVLEFILKNQPVSDESVERRFGGAGLAAIERLRSDSLAEYGFTPPSPAGKVYKLPESLRATKTGELELSNFKAGERRVRRNLFWTRILAIIAILISLGSLAVSFLSLQQGR